MAPRRTPLHSQHVAARARLVDFAGWEMPQQYGSVRQEHLAVRQSAGLFDVSHMGRLSFEGPAAGALLNRLVTNDVGRVEPGQAQYNLLCNEGGGVIDDLVVYRDPDGGWHAVVNASNREKDLAWLRERAPSAVGIRDRTEELALLALQGPQAEAMLRASGAEVAGLGYFGVLRGSVAGAPALISRTGYTGEDGFELFVAAERAGGVWEALLEAGATPCGLAARDVCRLESGLRLYGNDMDESVNPYEAGLGWTVKLEKSDFVGRSALQAVKAAGVQRTTVGLECLDRIIPRHGAALRREGEPVGTVTSGTYSFFLHKGIGFALVRAGAVATGSRVTVAVHGGEGEGQVVPLPFYRGSVRQRARA